MGKLGRRLHRAGALLAGRVRVELRGLEARFRVTCRRDYNHVAGYLFEREQIEAFVELLCGDDVVYEVGGHTGSWTVFLAKRAGHVHVFEPESRNRERLAANLRLNGLRNVTVHRFAVGDRSGTMEFGVADRRGDGRHSLVASAQHDRVIPVDVIPLAEAPARLGVPRPTAVKIDVEGAEGLVIAGAQPLLRGLRLVFVELHPHAVDAPQREQLLQTLADAGLDVHARWTRGGEDQVLLIRGGSRASA